jgi:thiol-disulfide isomerase/thioredoxin
MKPTVLIILAGLFALISGMVVRNLDNSATVQTSVTADLFAKQLPDLSEQAHSLKEWQGKTLIINFWATWCPPCLKEIPEFIAMQKEYANKNVQFIGIAIDDKQAVKDYAAKMSINYPILLATDNGIDIARQWGNIIESLPFTVIVNPQGKIIHRQLGEITRIELETIIKAANE